MKLPPKHDNPQDFSHLQQRTARAFSTIENKLQMTGRSFSLSQLILAGLPDAAHLMNHRELADVHELADLAKQAGGGKNPDGTWVPLQALTRDLTTTTASSAVGARVQKELTASLAPASVLMAGGATILTGINGSQLTLPGIGTGIDATGAAWLGEGSAAPQREPAFAARTLTPKSLSIEMRVSRRLLIQSSVSIEDELRLELLTRFGREFDRVALYGDGVLEPLGLLRDSAVETLAVGTNGGAPAWDHFVDAEAAVAGRVGQLARPAWLVSTALRKKMRKTQRATGLDFILTGSSLFDCPVLPSTVVPSNLTKGTGTALSAMLYGDMQQAVIGFWGPLAVDLLVDPFTLAKDGFVRLIGRAEIGVVARAAGAFTSYKDFVTT